MFLIFQVAKAQSLRDSLRPVIMACSKEHGVTDADIQAAKDAGSAASIPPCFIACVFKKAGFVSTCHKVMLMKMESSDHSLELNSFQMWMISI